MWCGWSHLGSGGAQPDLTSQLITDPTGQQQNLLCDRCGNLKLSSNRFFGLQFVLYSSSPNWNLLSQLVLISSGFGPRLVALRILQELGVTVQQGRWGQMWPAVWPVGPWAVGHRQS